MMKRLWVGFGEEGWWWGFGNDGKNCFGRVDGLSAVSI